MESTKHSELNRTRMAVCCCRNDDRLTLKGDLSGLAALLGYSLRELEEDFGGSLLELVPADERSGLLNGLKGQLTDGAQIEAAFPLCTKGGGVIWVVNQAVPETVDGEDCLNGILFDFTRTKQLYDVKKHTLEQYQIILSQTGNVVFDWDFQQDEMYFSDAWKDTFGFAPHTKGMRSVIAEGGKVHPDDARELFRRLKTMEEGTSYQILSLRILCANGAWMWCKVRATGIYDADGELVRIVGLIIDINEEKNIAVNFQEQAERDSLTKLYNTRTTRRLAEEYFAGAADIRGSAMLIIDIDDFKGVNDRYGHMFGDETLTCLAGVIRSLFRSDDIVGRVGGDEFLVLMKNVSDRERVEDRCLSLRTLFRDAMREHGKEREITCSVGVAIAPPRKGNYDDLFVKADQALYAAKNGGRNRHVLTV